MPSLEATKEDEKEYCYYEYKEASIHIYKAILDVCKRRGIAEVHDIGCSFAFQAKLFSKNNIAYLGIEADSEVEPYVPRGKNIFYRFVIYPTECPCIISPWHTAAISSLCVGYLCSGDDVWNNMAQTCEYFVGSIPKEEIPIMKKYYDIQQVYRFPEAGDIVFGKRIIK